MMLGLSSGMCVRSRVRACARASVILIMFYLLYSFCIKVQWGTIQKKAHMLLSHKSQITVNRLTLKMSSISLEYHVVKCIRNSVRIC